MRKDRLSASANFLHRHYHKRNYLESLCQICHTSQISSNVFKYCVFLYSKHVVATLLDSAAKNKHLMLSHLMYTYIRFTCVFKQKLQWRCNERDGVSNHRRPDCLLNRLFMRRSTKTSKLLVTGFSEGNPTVMIPLNNWPVTQNMSPCDDVIMTSMTLHDRTYVKG